RETCLTGTVLDRVECDLHLFAGLDLHLPALVLELLEGNDGFGLQAYVDDDDVAGDFDDEPGKYHSRADALVGETLLEELGETFCHTFTDATQMACVYWTRLPRGPGKHNGHPHPARAFLGLPSPVRIATSGPSRPQATSGSQFQHPLYHRLHRKTGRVDETGIGRGLQWGDLAGLIPQIPLGYLARKGGKANIGSLV